MTTPLDNQELDKKIVTAMGGDPQYRTTHNFDHIKQLVLEEAHRIGNLAIGEYDKHGSGQNTAWEAGVDWCNSLREGQRQRLSKLTGLKNE